MKNAEFTRAFAGQKDDDSVIPRFYVEAEPVSIDGKTEYRDVQFVECIMPGNTLTKPVFRVSDKHRERWPNQYDAFKRNQETPIDGIPLEEWPVLKPSMILTLKSYGFRTVEHIASMGDLACQKIGMGGMELRVKAKAYLSDEASNAITNKAIEDAAKFKELSENLQGQVERTNEGMRQLMAEMQTLRMNQHLASQNIASTPQVPGIPAMVQDEVKRVDQFASFVNDVPRNRIKAELQALSNGQSVQAPRNPPQETITIAPNKPKRGRPSAAEIAARHEQESAVG